ncbi:hypothetical protein N0B51_10565 [Tsuneonella sp. YG55]|uniref:Uncharacterized protein n=1 Tax=Tsuneonella litorea TaxID=2976475 RepID=A0A9X2W4C2_9SPHN|nr:hypothetical protein [Tsuneonella litorea]MCT2559421.1 hypothetical protein [Tsuneonella litorea]
MPLISEERAARAREILRQKLSMPLGCWGGDKTVMSETELKARLGWKDATK